MAQTLKEIKSELSTAQAQVEELKFQLTQKDFALRELSKENQLNIAKLNDALPWKHMAEEYQRRIEEAKDQIIDILAKLNQDAAMG